MTRLNALRPNPERGLEDAQTAETRRLLRVSFYADLNRRPPTEREHLPSYVRAVRKKWNLKYNNSARQLLAQVEGFASWEQMMAASVPQLHRTAAVTRIRAEGAANDPTFKEIP